ncbi:hypothetical protein B0T17DRAFT_505425 [Bombardia bombarda]|uniref:Protein sip5 n=1 Tax=Bombardia bombarda TaxID=252184 RepID=A0AA39X7V6_9PEZI|nr:hypothetical protein B0T17DRAFT_505425 [Bombardia bombarda]
MGNTSSRDARGGNDGHRSHHSGPVSSAEVGAGASRQSERSSNRRGRGNRGELGGILGLGGSGGGASGSQTDPPYERRETKQEREARRLERERVARIAERERSMKEESVDGGYLVTMGTYTGSEDFNKQVVRQLQIERKIAPFWRGLNDIDGQWTEFQIVAAARGMPIPPADQPPPDDLMPKPLSAAAHTDSARNLNNLTVPLGERTQSMTSENSVSNAGSALASPTSGGNPPRANSPFKPRGKALAAVLGGTSRNGSTTEVVPREITLPNDPYINGQPIEVFLYKDATECPICFLSYPPYLNHTRCCDQAICSECFVQIKRPDPHFPEGHNENDPDTNPEETAGMLVSEPACCPYCTQPDFGVTYEPPPFRRGLSYVNNPPPVLDSMNTAMSSNSSLNSGTNLSPNLGSPISAVNRRRTQSLSVHASNVILTDRIRPEWATKLQAARAHQARRAAAATALHTAAFLMGTGETRAFRSRFGRRNTGGSGSASAGASPGGANAGEGDNGDSGPATPPFSGLDGPRGGSGRGLAAGGGPRRSRMEDLEDMMLMEAIRLSLAAEEERKRKSEKEEKKEAKKREKEERKAAKTAAKHGGGPYEAAGGRSGLSSASGSTLSLPGLGFGRKRGNSGASNLRVEAGVASAVANTGGMLGSSGSPSVSDPNLRDKGKAVDRGLPATPEGAAVGAVASEQGGASTTTTTTTATIPISTTSRPASTPHPGPSHLRQMSSASSVESSIIDSQPGSYTLPSQMQQQQGPHASGLSLSGASEDGGERDGDKDPSASTESMFNFRSLAEVVGVSLEGENAGRRLSYIEADSEGKKAGGDDRDIRAAAGGGVEREAATAKTDEANESTQVERIEDVGAEGPGGGTGEDYEFVPDYERDDSWQEDGQEEQQGDETIPGRLPTPKVTITPGTPAPVEDGVGGDSKQLGHDMMAVEQQQHHSPQHQVAQ